MTGKMKVKVVKKSETQKQPGKQNTVKATRIAAREMVSNVTDWVTEFKSRRSEETKAGFEKLFSNQPRPSES
jgi:hypothetical protein